MEIPRNDNIINVVRRYQRLRLIVVQICCFYICWLHHRKRSQNVRTYAHLNSRKERVREEIMGRIIGSNSGRKITRMGPKAFVEFCVLLEKYGGLRATRQVSIEEQVAKTLYILGHHAKSRTVQFWFLRSGETTSRHFHSVLASIIELEDKFMKQPDGSEIPAEILHNSRFHPYFKDCIGAIDGTHIRVKVSPIDAPRFHGRKDYPTQNVLAACTFDLRFTYVLAGWEGSASDSRIIKNALSREDKLIIPSGKFYLVDAGFMLRGGLTTPYRGVRYHVKEYSRNNPPQNARELFNLRHASLRSSIERAFGVLKKRFPIIASANEPTYGVETQKKIIFSCCIVHNYLMGVDPDENLIAEVDNEIRNQIPQRHNVQTNEDEDTAQGQHLRDSIANNMWNDYNE